MSVDVRDNEECTGDNTNSGVIEQVTAAQTGR
jgi:hypothetical protein